MRFQEATVTSRMKTSIRNLGAQGKKAGTSSVRTLEGVFTTLILDDRILGLSWQSMALGDAIDQQRTVRERFSKEDAAMQAQGLPEPGGDDDDFDPTDPVQPPANPGNPVPPAQPSGLYDSGDDSDYW